MPHNYMDGSSFPARQTRRLLVDRQFQLRYGITLGAIGFVMSIVTGAGLLMMMRSHYDFLMAQGLLSSPQVIERLTTEQNAILFRFCLLSTGVIFLMTLLGIWVTRRFVGPVKGFERELKKLSDGDFSCYLQLRGGDEFHDVALLFNSSMERLRLETQRDISLISNWTKELSGSQSSEAESWIEDKRRRVPFFK